MSSYIKNPVGRLVKSGSSYLIETKIEGPNHKNWKLSDLF